MKPKNLHKLPEFPRTLHLPWKPNTQRGDLTANDADIIFQLPHVYVEEKIDGANCGMALIDGHPVIRNRDHILKKGFQKDTPAKRQFVAIWNWFYDHQDFFEALEGVYPNASVYGEWMVAQHGLEYDKLPGWFVAYDLYDYAEGQFVRTDKAREMLSVCGFDLVPLIWSGPVENYPQIEEFTLQPSPFTTKEPREGIYIKVSKDNRWITHRFKMVRHGFVQGKLWSKDALQKNSLARS